MFSIVTCKKNEGGYFHICDRTCEKGPIAFKIILSFSAKLRLRSILGKTFLAAIQYLQQFLEPITGSFIPSAQLRDGSLFLDSALQIRKIKVLFNAHAYATK